MIGAFIIDQSQKPAILALANGRSVEWHIEEGSVKRPDDERVELQRCLDFCRTNSATFAVATLKGLFHRQWMAKVFLAETVADQEISVSVADDPIISKSTIHLIARYAESERNRIVKAATKGMDRIRKELEAGRPHVTKSGKLMTKIGYKDYKEWNQIGNASRIATADKFALAKYPEIKKLLDRGMNQSEIARQLNIQGVEFRGNKSWTQPAIFRILQRIKSLGES